MTYFCYIMEIFPYRCLPLPFLSISGMECFIVKLSLIRKLSSQMVCNALHLCSHFLEKIVLGVLLTESCALGELLIVSFVNLVTYAHRLAVMYPFHLVDE